MLRLDGNPRAQLASREAAVADFTKTDELGNVEEEVISKWAAGDVGVEEESGSEEEEE